MAAAGVEDAIIAWPRQGGRLTNLLFGTPIPAQVAQLTLYSPTPPRWRVYVEAPDAWLEEAAAWVEGGPGPRKTVSASVAATEFSLAPGATKGFLRQALDMRTNSCRVVSGRIDKAMRVAAVGYFGAGIMPSVGLSAGGATMGEADLGAVFESLVAVARRLAPTVSYAHVAIQPCFSGYPGGSGDIRLPLVIDEYAVDGFAYQVLGPGHLARLGAPPPGSAPLEEGRVELRVGDVGDWMIGPATPGRNIYWDVNARRRAPAVLERARQLLSPLLVPHSMAPVHTPYGPEDMRMLDRVKERYHL